MVRATSLVQRAHGLWKRAQQPVTQPAVPPCLVHGASARVASFIVHHPLSWPRTSLPVAAAGASAGRQWLEPAVQNQHSCPPPPPLQERTLWV